MLYVAPDFWRAGVGNQLFDSGTAYLRGRGFPELVLWVLEDNERARRFYEKKGWRPDGAKKPSFSRPALSQMRYRVRRKTPWRTRIPWVETHGIRSSAVASSLTTQLRPSQPSR